MKQAILPEPPNPDDQQYKGQPLYFNRAIYQWGCKVKSILEQQSSINDIPLGQNFVIGTYALNTFISGTSTGTDVSNFIASLISAMTARGIISQKIQGGKT